MSDYRNNNYDRGRRGSGFNCSCPFGRRGSRNSDRRRSYYDDDWGMDRGLRYGRSWRHDRYDD